MIPELVAMWYVIEPPFFPVWFALIRESVWNVPLRESITPTPISKRQTPTRFFLLLWTKNSFLPDGPEPIFPHFYFWQDPYISYCRCFLQHQLFNQISGNNNKIRKPGSLVPALKKSKKKENNNSSSSGSWW